MAKKKVNVRKDYDLEARDVVVYKKSNIPRQMRFMILRGPGLDVQHAIEENNELKGFASKKRIKLKFMQAVTLEDVVMHLKDANTWATGVIYQMGVLKDESEIVKKTIKRLLIPALEISESGKVQSMVDGLKSLAA